MRITPITWFPRLLPAARRWLGPLLLTLSLPAVAAPASAPPVDCPPVAQVPTQEQAQVAAKAARDRGFLWRIQKNDRVSYLYGTIHVGRLEWLFPGPRVMQAIRASDVVALELDMADPAVLSALQSGMAKEAAQPALPPPLEARLRAQVRAACLPEGVVDIASPEMLVLGLVASAARRDGLDPAYAIDPSFAGVAKALKKPVDSLETVDLQLQLLRSSNRDELLDGLDKTLRDLEQGKSRRSLIKVSQVWEGGRFDELASYASWCECQDTEAERAELKQLLDDRNPAMAEHIDRLHAGGRSVFAAVGALHMIGPLGLPKLMRDRGYDVTRIEFRPSGVKP
jgi:uncharacterized protein YbaP (TraB family)